MKFSYQWIKDFVPGLNIDARRLEQRITVRTAECEGVESIAEWADGALRLGPDQVIEIDNKSLTHRPDLWGHLGMAREVAAILELPLVDPVDESVLPYGGKAFDVEVRDFDLCPRFSAITFRGVRIGPSPPWLQYRLLTVGLNPINNVVDITNYVSAELAQPMHAFDRDLLRGDRLVVRPALEGETVVALNKEQYELSPADGVIADATGAVSIAGIIGGLDSAISDRTTNVVFESANWRASQIRKTSSHLKLRTDASMRYEKAQDPLNTVRALSRAIVLMKELCPEAEPAGPLADIYRALPEPQSIHLRLEVINRKLGRDVPASVEQDILERLGFRVERLRAGVLKVTVPSWRATKDIAIADDLVEEVGRMIGYDTITPIAPEVECRVPPPSPERFWFRQLRSLLSARGFTEVYNYSFLSEEQADRFQLPREGRVRVLNPIAADQNYLRSSLVPGIIANVELNAKNFAEFRLFEIGREIHNEDPAPPREISHLVAARFDKESDGAEALFELKLLMEEIVPGGRVEPIEDALIYEHPARTAKVMVGSNVCGRLFEAHPNLVEGRVALLDLDLERVSSVCGEMPAFRYAPFRRFPSSAFDLSVVTRDRELAATVARHIQELAGPVLEDVEYLREYSGPPFPEGKKSVSYRLTLGSADRTLSSDEINAVRERVIEGMQALGYEMRV